MRNSGLTGDDLLIIAETVATETSADRATSRMVGADDLRFRRSVIEFKSFRRWYQSNIFD